MRPPEAMYHPNIAEDESRSSCALNRCNLSPWIIGSEEFQAAPLPVEIDGVRSTDARLFRRLEEIADPDERTRLFHEYLTVKFSLNETASRRSDGKARPVYSCVHLLRAWGADSNGSAGAVLKAWVESRFGILATYHAGRLADNAAAREAFLRDRMRGAAKSIGVLMQLDLLYTFCQDELRRRLPGQRWQTLYRGTHDSDEYTIRTSYEPARDSTESQSRQTPTCCGWSATQPRSGSASRFTRELLVQLNNLSSFASDPEVVWEFGSSAWEVKVPLAKIVFFSGLLPRSVLSGESEHLVLGGYYQVRTRLF